MKTFGGLLLFLAAVMLLASDAGASGCLARARVVQRRAVVVHQQRAVVAVRQVAVAAVFVPVAALLQPPGYSATYGGPDQSGDLLRELQALRAEIEALKRARVPDQPGVEPIAPPKGEAGAALAPVAFAACAACHTEGRVKGGLALIDRNGNAAPLTAEQRLEVLRRIDLDVTDSEHMPPKAELPEESLAGITAAVLQRKGK